MAIEKSLYAAPQGLEALDQMNQDEPALEIEIENPESVTIGLDGEPILTFTAEEAEEDFSKNLAEGMKSYALSFYLQDAQQTLTDKHIEKAMQQILQALEKDCGATLRM